jgi:hypothetical protein
MIDENHSSQQMVDNIAHIAQLPIELVTGNQSHTEDTWTTVHTDDDRILKCWHFAKSADGKALHHSTEHTASSANIALYALA